ncbi:hypothetical protein [Streptomyces rubradiris]|uniref:Uncharacterized protein n=1 Tax=Streptomyces rubradiris TaxID=285531 RepID=A0ABQ3R3C1_STRRR|nr:hypothetical protein [Streptomyces rubradiris]GHH29981.1 hypothetical protein GCM10018792_75800 [Streptomyces rubradiris]GHI50361.1 hypothetical protein Srubr_02070 [Streptomyces rubradiris]
MLVAKSKYVDIQRALKVETGRRELAEAKIEQQATTIARFQAQRDDLRSQLQHLQDEHPDTPVSVQPAVGGARVAQQLALLERARRSLDEQVRALHKVNMQQEQEIVVLRAQLAALQPVEESAS